MRCPGQVGAAAWRPDIDSFFANSDGANIGRTERREKPSGAIGKASYARHARAKSHVVSIGRVVKERALQRNPCTLRDKQNSFAGCTTV